MTNYRGLDIAFADFGGGVTTDSLFCDKEQPILDFYEAAGERYQRALDIGANVGVHSMLMARQGWEVRAFEPDPSHFVMLRRNVLKTQAYPGITAKRAAVSDRSGRATFVRVKGNTTGSHLEGDKTPYGPLERFDVEVVDCRPLFDWAEFCKMDCEGHEARLLLTVTPEQKCEFMVEVGNENNAKAIYEHFRGWRGMWAQKNDWKPVQRLIDVPKHHSEGALFIGQKEPFP